MGDTKVSVLFRIVKGIIRLIYPKIEIVGLENLPEGPCIIAANHCQMNGPISCELYFPGKRYTWCAGEMMNLKDVPAYAYRDFWSQKPACIRWFYRVLSYLIAPLSVLVFNNADTIGVYRDTRIISTFRSTVKHLCSGARIVIFPECDEKYNHILYRFQEGYVEAARLYHRKTARALSFAPMYIAPKLKKMYIGKPVYFQPDQPFAQERERINAYLMDAITEMAVSLPEHTVIPYRNISKRLYPKNTPQR